MESSPHPLITHAVALETVVVCLTRVGDALTDTAVATEAGAGPHDGVRPSVRDLIEDVARTCSTVARGCRVSRDAYRHAVTATPPSTVDGERLRASCAYLQVCDLETGAVDRLRIAAAVEFCGEQLRATMAALGIRYRPGDCPLQHLETAAAVLRSDALQLPPPSSPALR